MNKLYYEVDSIIEDLEVRFTYKNKKYAYKFGELLREIKHKKYVKLNQNVSSIEFMKTTLAEFLKEAFKE